MSFGGRNQVACSHYSPSIFRLGKNSLTLQKTAVKFRKIWISKNPPRETYKTENFNIFCLIETKPSSCDWPIPRQYLPMSSNRHNGKLRRTKVNCSYPNNCTIALPRLCTCNVIRVFGSDQRGASLVPMRVNRSSKKSPSCVAVYASQRFERNGPQSTLRINQ